MVGAIIQARMGSTRLPGKVLKPIGDKTLLEHIFSRLKKLKHSVKIVLATSNDVKDNILEQFCNERAIECFLGSEDNVLERYFFCAKQHAFEHIIRLTADNPFVDIEELDRLIDLHISSQADYSHSFSSLPIGIGSEVFTFAALEKSYKEGLLPNQIEHVNEYITDNPNAFKISELKVYGEKNRPDIRLTIDNEYDYHKACYIVKQNNYDYVDTNTAIRLGTLFENE